MSKLTWPYTVSPADCTEYDPSYSWPKISLVTPTYNQGDFIEECILSIVNQKYPNLEYVIIDGGSTDNTVEVIKKYQQHITYWVSEPDKGQSDAINKGLAKCTGDIFNWVNSDDHLEPNALYEIASCFMHNNVEVVAGYRRKFTREYTLTVDPHIDRVRLEESVEKSIVNIHFIQLPTFFSLSVIRKLQGINQNLHYVMDTELWMRYLLAFGQSKVWLIDEVLANYRLHPSSKTVSSKEKFKHEWGLVCETFYAQLNIEKSVRKKMGLPTLPDLDEEYDLSLVSKDRLKQFIYERALVHYIGFTQPVLFFKCLRKIIMLSSLGWRTIPYVYYTFFLPRIKARLTGNTA